MSKCLVLFVEGDTEVEFYKHVIANAKKLRSNGRFDTSIECRNINGVGGFKNNLPLSYVGAQMFLNCHRNRQLDGMK